MTLVALALLLAWDASTLDLSVVRLFGTDHGFDWRDTWWASTVLHQGGRLLAFLLLLGMVAAALRAPRSG